MFIEIHSLHTHIGALLNRDQNGQAKTIPVGGTLRTRISSQCLKHHLRHAEGEFAISNIDGYTGSVRSRDIITQMVMNPLRGAEGYSQELLDMVENIFNENIYGKSASEKEHRQTLMMGAPEIEFLQRNAREVTNANQDDPKAAKEAIEAMFDLKTPEGRNFKALLHGSPLNRGTISAMFGRMNTSDREATTEGAICVSHLFTVHAQETTPDFFTTVDDLGGGDEGGTQASLLTYSELNTGVYYGNVVVDVKQLVSNTQGCAPSLWMDHEREMAAQIVRNLIHLIATVSPGSKRGSTAPFGEADLMLVEIGTGQPRSLGKAYLRACEPNLLDAIRALATQVQKDDRMYGSRRARRFASTEETQIPEAPQHDIYNLADWAADAVRSGYAEVVPAEAELQAAD